MCLAELKTDVRITPATNPREASSDGAVLQANRERNGIRIPQLNFYTSSCIISRIKQPLTGDRDQKAI